MENKNDEKIIAKKTGETLKEHTKNVLEKIKEMEDVLREKLANQIKEPDNFWKYLKWAAFIHDFGKVYDGFQKKMKNEELSDDEKELANMHSFLSPVFTRWYEWDMDEKWLRFILSAVVTHHHRFNVLSYLFMKKEWRIKEKIESIIKKEKYKDYIKKLRAELEDINQGDINTILPDENEEVLEDKDKKDKYSPFRFSSLIIPPESIGFLPEYIERVGDLKEEDIRTYIFFKGFLLRADRFASAESEIGEMNKNVKGRIDKEKPKIETRPVSDNIHKIADKIVQEINRRSEEKEKKKKGKKIKKENMWQYNVLKNNAELKKKKVLVLKGSTGIGKTEFAFLWGAGDKIIFTYPIRTMVDAGYHTAIKYFERKFEEKKENMMKKNEEKNEDTKKVGLLHGTSLVSLYDLLEKKEDRESMGEIDFIRLESRFLSYPIIMATGDQIFPAVLKYPGYEMIMSVLGYSALVVDEIQAYDPEATAIIVKTIEETVKMGGRVLIITATLPEYIREAISKRTEKYGKVEIMERYTKYTEDNPNFIKHKIHFITDHDEVKEKTVNDFVKKFLLEKLQKYKDKKCLIIVNTVKNAQEVYDTLVKDEELGVSSEDILLLHSRFIAGEREEKLKRIGAIETEKDKNEDKRPSILITTQIVEASVDIDYDVLFTELAPLECLIQRMGRVNRKRGEYEEGKGDVYIWGHYLKGTISIYQKEILKCTAGCLKEFLKEKEKKVSEKEKQVLLSKYFAREEFRNIEDKFSKNLSVLDDLYTAESRKEAQKIFRDVVSTNVLIPEGGKEGKKIWEEIEKQINEVDKKDIKRIKLEIYKLILEHTISIPWKEKEKDMIKVTELTEFRELEKKYKNNELVNFVKNILEDYHILKGWEYDEKKGLHKKDDKAKKEEEKND